MNKLILKTALITLSAIIGILAIICLILGIWFPLTFAKFFENTGSNNASFYFYEKTYSKTNDINDTYFLLNKAIEFKIDKKVVYYYENLSKYSRYDEFIKFINKNNFSQENSVAINSILTNEDNRLKTRYVSSLAKIDLDKAYNFAIDDLFNTQVIEGNINLNFVISGLYKYIDENNIKYFEQQEYAKQGILVADKIMDYYNQINDVYQNGKESFSKYYLAVYSNKLIDICQTMILLEKYLNKSKIQSIYDINILQQTLNTLVGENKEYCK